LINLSVVIKKNVKKEKRFYETLKLIKILQSIFFVYCFSPAIFAFSLCNLYHRISMMFFRVVKGVGVLLDNLTIAMVKN